MSIVTRPAQPNTTQVLEEFQAEQSARLAPSIARMEPGKLWLEIHDGRKRRSFGPIPVPASVTKLLREDWDVGCALGRVRGTWRIVEIGTYTRTDGCDADEP